MFVNRLQRFLFSLIENFKIQSLRLFTLQPIIDFANRQPKKTTPSRFTIKLPIHSLWKQVCAKPIAPSYHHYPHYPSYYHGYAHGYGGYSGHGRWKREADAKAEADSHYGYGSHCKVVTHKVMSLEYILTKINNLKALTLGLDNGTALIDLPSFGSPCHTNSFNFLKL